MAPVHLTEHEGGAPLSAVQQRDGIWPSKDEQFRASRFFSWQRKDPGE
jgi:hypothetical protein